MARAGAGGRKVRTGCITCKIRKVKCDEAKPACKRCTSTGRHCDGYQTAVNDAASATAARLLMPRHVSPVIGTTVEARALQYFFQAAGPSLSGAMDSSFWTHVVMRLSTSEPAVKHSVIAISSLYEQGQGPPQGTPATSSSLPSSHRLALRHYNAAIQELRAMNSWEKQPAVLLVCILFVCIEIMRANRELALQHCRHGFEILKTACRQSPWIQEHIVPIFRRLGDFLFFFGGDEDLEFSCMSEPEVSVPLYFSTLDDAQAMIDVAFERTTHLMRQAAPYRFGSLNNESIPLDLLAEQASINQYLDLWFSCLFYVSDGTLNQSTSTSAARSEADFKSRMLRCFLLTRYECCRIWLSVAFDATETGYDKMHLNFRRVLDQLLQIEPELLARSHANSHSSPPFIMEMGFGAMLFFLLTACRHLSTRLEFLRLMPLFVSPRENFWERDTLIDAGRSIIELEHGVRLDVSDQLLGPPGLAWPAEEARVLNLWGNSTTRVANLHFDKTGTFDRQISLFRRDSTGTVYLHTRYLIDQRRRERVYVEQ
ncbi:hypothetical protein ACJ41O_012544 [Fusarium nematophilum]